MALIPPFAIKPAPRRPIAWNRERRERVLISNLNCAADLLSAFAAS